VNKISVIGASILDVTGLPNENLIKGDSNPGHIFITPGGVGRNIAENLTLLGIDIEMFTALGNDQWGKILSDFCHNSGIKISKSVRSDSMPTALYLSINNFQKNLELAVVNTDITEEITPEFIEKNYDEIIKSNLIVAETNLTKDTLKYISEKFKNIPVFLDLVSVIKAKKVKDFIGSFHTIKPNIAEAEMLTGIKMNSTKDLLKMSDYFIEKGVKQVFITMGKKGCFYSNQLEKGIIEGISIEALNASGAGDAYISGVAFCYLKNKDVKSSAIFGTAMSLAAVMDKNSVNTNITENYIENIINKYDICSKNILI